MSKGEEYKRLVNGLKPESIVYNIEQTGISKAREFTNLRLIRPFQKLLYLRRFSKRETLEETKIPIRKDATGTRCIEEDDIRASLKRELDEKLRVYSY